MTVSDPIKRRLALSIISFLNTSLKDGTLPQEETESIEVANGIIAEAFGVDPQSSEQEKAGLAEIFGVWERTREKMNQQQSSSSSNERIPEDSAEAEKEKSLGNAAVSQKNFPLAISHYTRALTLSPDNPIYLSNRAAAYSQNGQHSHAAADALRAVELDPGYAKGWGRLGHARFALGDAGGSKEAYEKGLACEGGQTELMNKGYQTASKKFSEQEAQSNPSSTSSTAASTSPSAGSGAPGGMPDLGSLFGGGGGMPDFAGMMNNPAFMQMANNLMSSGALNDIMNNPRMAEMARGLMNGDRGIGDMLQDPEVQNLARQFGRGSGGGSGGGAGDGAGGGTNA